MPIWYKNDVDVFKKCKPNIANGVSGYAHCESSGKYYSFGNRANFRVKNGQSLTQYVCKTSKNEGKQKLLQNLALDFGKQCSGELIHSLLSLNRYLPGVSHLISPIMEAADELQRKRTIDIGLKKLCLLKGGYGVHQLLP